MTPSEQFKQMFPVRKDLQSLRRKGVMLEDIGDYISDAKDVCSRVSCDTVDSGIPMMSCYSSLTTNEDQTIGIYTFSARMGIPTVAVGVMSKDAWTELRAELRTENLVR